MEYLVVSDFDEDNFEQLVNSLIAEGFKPHGGVDTCLEIIGDRTYLYMTQAMVKGLTNGI